MCRDGAMRSRAARECIWWCACVSCGILLVSRRVARNGRHVAVRHAPRRGTTAPAFSRCPRRPAAAKAARPLVWCWLLHCAVTRVTARSGRAVKCSRPFTNKILPLPYCRAEHDYTRSERDDTPKMSSDTQTFSGAPRYGLMTAWNRPWHDTSGSATWPRRGRSEAEGEARSALRRLAWLGLLAEELVLLRVWVAVS